MTPRVLNRFPSIDPVGARIAVIVASPGRDEVWQGVPIAGESGRLLRSAFEHLGVVWDRLFVGSVCQAEVEDVGGAWSSDAVQQGIEQLRADLERFKPTMVLCLGNEALHLFKEGNVAPLRRGKAVVWPNSIGDWRGSLFESRWMPGLKCMGSYHPGVVCRDYGLQVYLKFDLKRLIDESRTRELVLPRRSMVIQAKYAHDAVRLLKAAQADQLPISIDIEGACGNVTSFSWTACSTSAFVIPFAHIDGTSVWSEADEVMIWQAVKELIEDPAVPKIAQNGLYDFFALAWTYGVVVQNFVHDTMIAWWELYAELLKGLATQTSILTKEPFYKPDFVDGAQVFESDEQFWRYNGLDACVTFECWQREMEQMGLGQRRHYEFNMSLMPGILFMELRGLLVDKSRVVEAQADAERGAFELQAKIDREAVKTAEWGPFADLYSDTPLTESKLAQIVLAQLCGKKPREKVEVVEERWQPMRWNGKKFVKAGKAVTELQPGSFLTTVEHDSERLVGDVRMKPVPRTVSKLMPLGAPSSFSALDPHVLDSNADAWKRVILLWRSIDGMPTEAQLGELSLALGLAVNISSTAKGGDAQRFLYEICGHQAQFKKVKGRKTDALATDQNALDAIYAKTQDVRVLWCLQQRRLKKVGTDLNAETDPDGRWRSSISLVKETGRMAMSTSPTGTGLNLQALNKDLRAICVADEGCVMMQCDLEGADSWTVAAECAACGDETMLLDLLAGLKPAKILCLSYLEGAEKVNEMSRDEIKLALKTVQLPSWLYPGAKASTHGTAYMMSWRTMIDTILKFSMADLPMKLEEANPIVLTKVQVEKLQAAVHARYPGLAKWHAKEGHALMTKGYVETSAGHVRRFYGRKVEWKRGQKMPCHETWKEALASKPQFWTTHATKIMLRRLWLDPENRRDGDLIVEPLLAVHDSALAQAKREDEAFARVKMKSWFENPVEIAGRTVTIPADGTLGPDWSMKGADKL